VREYSEGAVEAAVSKVREQLEAERRRRKQAEAALEAELRTQKQLVRHSPRLPSLTAVAAALGARGHGQNGWG